MGEDLLIGSGQGFTETTQFLQDPIPEKHCLEMLFICPWLQYKYAHIYIYYLCTHDTYTCMYMYLCIQYVCKYVHIQERI